METWITLLGTPGILALMAWFFNRKTSRIDDISKLVLLLQTEISRMSEKMVRMEAKIEDRDKELEMKNIIIQECWACKTPSAKCPPLKMQAQFNRQKILNHDDTNFGDNTTDNDISVHATQDDNNEQCERPP